MKIKRLKIKGFRGFKNEGGFELPAPVVIFFGENAKGKSSALNAIEWCLFGKEVIGKNTGIRERIDWEIKNRNADECWVEMEIENDGNNYVLRRKLIGQQRDDITITISSDNQTITGEDTQRELNKLLKGYTFKDFMTCVYQHQEAIRFVLTQEPKERNEALDRLFGLSDYRNIIDGISKSEIKGDELEREIENLKQKIKAKIDVWNEQIKNKEKELNGKVKEISNEGGKELAQEIKSFIGFYSNIRIEPTEQFNSIDISNFLDFSKGARKEITRLRSEMPDVQRQTEIIREMNALTQHLEAYRRKREEFNKWKKELDEFIKANGDKDSLNEKKKEKEEEINKIEKEKEQVSILGAAVEKVINYLESEGINKNKCPICGTEKENLLAHLKEEWTKRYKDKLEDLNKKLDEKKQELKNIQDLISKYEKLENVMGTAEKDFSTYKEDAMKTYQIGEREDPEAHLNSKLEKLKNEQESIKKIVEERQNELNKIEEKIKNLEILNEILKMKDQREKAREIENTQIWQDLKNESERMKKLRVAINSIIHAIKTASHDETKSVIDSTQKKIFNYFKKMTNHPMIKDLKIIVEEDRRTGGNSYQFRDQNDKDVTSILSQGNYNSLALSIFMSMSEELAKKMPFEFVMFDDPSQSLGGSEKSSFVEILNEIAEKKNLIIATMDNELFERIKEKITKEKKIYKFTKWDDNNGPTINEE